MGRCFLGTDLVNPDFVKLAEAYGANGVRVTSVKELVPALESALKSDVITIIDVQTPEGFENFGEGVRCQGWKVPPRMRQLLAHLA